MKAPVGMIALTGMEFHAYHGVHDYETRKGARFVVDVEMSVPAPLDDTLNQTVDYSRVYGLIQREMTGRNFKLIESLAGHLADAIMAAEPLVAELLVRVHKPHAPLAGIVRDVSCEQRRTRD
ncbi:MAG TPA: dihydroneopterin aldolase [Trueperaceae bacterium]|nr:dihydroneopterin aldolase [Trueperaceae bacterium]